jgi:hypothetical protein
MGQRERVAIAVVVTALLVALALPVSSQAAHHYVTVRNGAYGYTGNAPSQTKMRDLPLPVAMIFLKYLGLSDGEYSFVWNNGSGNVIWDKCKSPCSEYSETQFTGSHIDSTANKKLDPEGGISQALEDAMAGALEISSQQAGSALSNSVKNTTETNSGDQKWGSDIENGPCTRLKDRYTDAAADVAACKSLYANQPPCLVYKSYAKIWLDMRNGRDPAWAYQPTMLSKLGQGNDETLTDKDPEFRAGLQRLLSATIGVDQSRFPNGDKWADFAYSRCMSGQFL